MATAAESATVQALRDVMQRIQQASERANRPVSSVLVVSTVSLSGCFTKTFTMSQYLLYELMKISSSLMQMRCSHCYCIVLMIWAPAGAISSCEQNQAGEND